MFNCSSAAAGYLGALSTTALWCPCRLLIRSIKNDFRKATFMTMNIHTDHSLRKSEK